MSNNYIFVGIYLTKEQKTWISQHANASDFVRKLIDKDMKAE